MPAVIIDTGPIVALLNPSDRWHAWLDSDFRVYRRNGRQVIPLHVPM